MLSRTAETTQFCALSRSSAPPSCRGLVASNPPSPEKAKTSKNDEKLTILQYLQKKAKTSISYSFPVSKTSKTHQNFEIWPKLQERGRSAKLRKMTKTSRKDPRVSAEGGQGQLSKPWLP
jgi:hypothetical protein